MITGIIAKSYYSVVPNLESQGFFTIESAEVSTNLKMVQNDGIL
jgi:hypothetical protein